MFLFLIVRLEAEVVWLEDHRVLNIHSYIRIENLQL